ncbi:hypothetical protein [Crossiella sp. CA198]|uniref:hypothetical protein n=1 Tax=Crossiella sp. CA198 TaxID=3455607 RepID=UPI003F8D87C2
MRSVAVGAGLVSVLAAVLSGCTTETAADEYDHVAVCVDPRTGDRVDDGRCGDDDGGSGGMAWFWISTSTSHAAPGVGQRVNVSHGSYTRPPQTSRVQRGGVPAAGGTVTRGGFGVSGTAGGGG